MGPCGRCGPVWAAAGRCPGQSLGVGFVRLLEGRAQIRDETSARLYHTSRHLVLLEFRVLDSPS